MDPTAESGEGELVNLSYGSEEFQVPKELLEDEDLFQTVVSEETWREALGEEDRERLRQLLPPGPPQQQQEDLSRVLGGEDVRFGNPVSHTLDKINSGVFCPELREACEEYRELRYQQYQNNQRRYYMKLLQDILIARQEVMQKALLTGSLDGLPSQVSVGRRRRKRSLLLRRADTKFRRIMRECREEWGEGGEVMSSDEDTLTNQIPDEEEPPFISEEDYRKMLRVHRESQMRKRMEQDLAAREIGRLRERRQERPAPVKTEVVSGTGSVAGGGGRRGLKDRASPADFSHPPPLVASGGGGEGKRGRRGRRGDRVVEKGVGPRVSAESKAVEEAYGPVDDGTRTEPPLLPVVLTAPLAECKFPSFFSLLKHAFDTLHDRKGEISKITKSVKIVMNSPEVEGSPWLERQTDWLDLVLPAIMYLSAEVGGVSSFDPLPFFYPIIEFRDRIDHWRWMGHDRDSELELLVLFNHWLDTLDRSLEIVDYSDYEPPTPINMWANFVFRPSTSDEVASFREQESFRYSQPFKSYIYNIHGFEAAVGPVKGAKAYKKDTGSRARGHALLIPDRPNCVTILSLVRDAASRLPNGEGTRVDLCVVVRDSQFIHEHVSDVQLNNAVSGALDRLHYEKDPCVRYDSTRKVWIYLHRGRSEEDFERIQWACDMAAKQRKMITTRPRVKPKILLREPGGGGEVVLMEGGPQTAPPTTAPSGNGAGGVGTGGKAEGGRGGKKGKSGGRSGGKNAANQSGGGSVVVVSVLGEREGVSPASSTSVSKPHKTHSKNKKKKSVSVVPVLSAVPPPSSLQPPPLTAADHDWEDSSDTPDLPFLSSLQPVGQSSSPLPVLHSA
ncbi:Nuclear factor related to kappa-B-binding protein [Geodia barretti]|uniref:Nuclear factor related to kappa-B-binding protein n=1 Tax=Geodia barretti TaxID=519541 RepID=A0AA35S7E3_GEOBA|nr:Nuclear factor related to kappa-B-binding protein [Geodia barretti]